jgi:hypothetical protein
MNRLFSTLALFLLAAVPLCAQDFEGKLSIQMSWRQGRSTTLYVQPERTMLVIEEPKFDYLMKLLSDRNAKTATISTRQAGETRVQQTSYEQLARSSETQARLEATTNVRPTGEMRLIEGRECFEYAGERDGRPLSAWVAPDLARIAVREVVPASMPDLALYLQLPGIKGLVVELVTEDALGHPVMVQTQVSEARLEASIFAQP